MSTAGLQVSSGVRVKANDVGIAWILAYIYRELTASGVC